MGDHSNHHVEVESSLKRIIDDVAMGLIAGFTLVAVLFLLVPVAMSVVMSFDARGFLGPFPPPSFSFRWYQKLFSTEYITNGMKTSILVGIIATSMSAILGLLTALGISKSKRHQAVLLSLFLSPLMVPGVVVGFSLLLFFSSLDLRSGFIRLCAGHLLITLPYTVRATLASLEGISPSLLEAAQSLGATERRAFLDITFPLAKTGIIAGAVFALAYSMDDVAVSIFLTDPDSQTLPIVLASMMRSDFDLSIAAAAVVFIGFTMGLVLVLDHMIGLDRIIGRGIYRA